jgi:hypothetical protein
MAGRENTAMFLNAEFASGVGTAKIGATRKVSLSWIAAVLACALGATPLLFTDLAPLQDWPSHLARIQILSTMLAGPSAWDRFYNINSFFLPNVILELVTLPLLKLGLTIDQAGRLFLLLLYAVFVLGFCKLAAANKTMTPLKLLFATLLFYNGSLFYGLVNFEFGLGVMMLMLGIWIDGTPKVRLAASTLGVAVIFPCHLVAAFLYVTILGCFDMHAVWHRNGRGLLRSTSLAALAVLLLFLFLSPAVHDRPGMAWAGDTGGILQLAKWKAGLFIKAILGRSFALDLAYAGGATVLATAVATGFRRHVSGPFILAISATALLTLLAPQRVGDGSLLDYRIAIVPWLLLSAGAAMIPNSRFPKHLALLCALLLVVARSLSLTVAGQAADTRSIVLDRSFANLPKDSVLLSGLARPLTEVSWTEFWSVSDSAVASRASRYGVFVPSIFADAAQQPLVLKTTFRPWNGYIDVSSPALLAKERARAQPLCKEFPAGVSMLVLYPAEREAAEMRRVGSEFGLLNMCATGSSS